MTKYFYFKLTPVSSFPWKNRKYFAGSLWIEVYFGYVDLLCWCLAFPTLSFVRVVKLFQLKLLIKVNCLWFCFGSFFEGKQPRFLTVFCRESSKEVKGVFCFYRKRTVDLIPANLCAKCKSALNCGLVRSLIRTKRRLVRCEEIRPTAWPAHGMARTCAGHVRASKPNLLHWPEQLFGLCLGQIKK